MIIEVPGAWRPAGSRSWDARSFGLGVDEHLRNPNNPRGGSPRRSEEVSK